MQSMTGFGRACADTGGGRLCVEIRSVNHRGLDVKVRSREPDPYCDHEITRAVRAAIERGSIVVGVRMERVGSGAGGGVGGRTGLDLDRATAAYRALEGLRQDLGVAAPVDLATVAAFLAACPDGGGDSLEGEALWEVLRPVIDQALSALVSMRRKEGDALAADMAERTGRLTALTREIGRAAEPLPARFARRITDRLAQAGAAVGSDPARLAQETLLMAERLDISEELVRLETHLGHMEAIVKPAATPIGKGPAAVGRKLDFIIQEVGRELNTIGSKAQDAGIAERVIEGKLELEKIREQAQNIE